MVLTVYIVRMTCSGLLIPFIFYDLKLVNRLNCNPRFKSNLSSIPIQCFSGLVGVGLVNCLEFKI